MKNVCETRNVEMIVKRTKRLMDDPFIPCRNIKSRYFKPVVKEILFVLYLKENTEFEIAIDIYIYIYIE
jgi:hypothetical protein